VADNIERTLISEETTTYYLTITELISEINSADGGILGYCTLDHISYEIENLVVGNKTIQVYTRWILKKS